MTKSMCQRTLGSRRGLLQVGALIVDCGGWLVGLFVALWARFEMDVTHEHVNSALAMGSLASAVQAMIGYGCGPYRGRHRCGSLGETRAIFLAVLTTGGALVAVNLTLPELPLPASAPVIAGLAALVVMLGARLLWRLASDRRARLHLRGATPVLLFGAGTSARSLVQAMLQGRGGRYQPVGLLDDDPGLKNLRIHGVPVLGDRGDIQEAAERTGARMLILSVSDADGQLIRLIRHRCLEAGLAFRAVPSLSEILDGQAAVADVRDVY